MATPRTRRDRPVRHSDRSAGHAAAQVQEFAQLAQWAMLVVVGRRIAFASRQAEQLLARAPGGLSGRTLRSVIAPVDAARLMGFLGGGRSRGRGPASVEILGMRHGGERVWLEARPSPIPWNGKPALLVLLADISARKAAAGDLSERERRYRRIVQSFRQGIVVLRDGKVLLANRALANLFGYPRARALAPGTDFLRLVAPKHRTRFKRTHEPGRAGRPSAAGPEYEGRRLDGAPVWFESLAQPVDWAGQPAVLATVSDTTARRHTEEALRANERLLQTVLDAIPGRLFVTDTRGRYLKVNREQGEALGRRPQDLVGQSSVKWASKVVTRAQAIGREERQVMKSGRALQVFARRESRPDGSVFWADVIKRPLRDAQGRIMGLVGLIFDVTGHQRVQEELRASRQLLQTIFDAIPEPLFVKDRSGRFIKVNHAMARAYGVSPEQMEGKPWSFVARVGADPIAVQNEDMQVMRTGKRVDVPDTLRTTRAGARWYRFVKVPLRDEKGKVSGLIALAQDVTARRQAEAALHAQQRLLRTTFDAMPVRITVKDRAGRFLMVNRPHVQATGVNERAFLGKSLAELKWVPAWRLKAYLEMDAEAARTKHAVELPELSMGRPGRPGAMARMISVPILDDQGEVEGIVTLWEDISARLAAEQDLRRSRRLLRTVFDAIPHEMTVKDAAGRFLIANRAYTRTFGQTSEQLQGKTVDDLRLYTPAVRREMKEADERVLASRALVEVPEALVERADGARRILRILKVPLLDEQGAPEGLVSLGEDITERLAAEQEVSRGRRLLQTVFDAIPYVMTVKDTDGRYLMTNRANSLNTGLPVEAFIGRRIGEIPGLPEEYTRQVIAADREVMTTRAIVERPEVRRRSADGSERVRRIVKLPLLDERGHMDGIVSLSEDITERLAAEQEKSRSRLLLQTVFDIIPHYLFVRDREGRFMMANAALANFYGMTPDQAVGRTLADVQVYDSRVLEEWRMEDRRVLETGETLRSGDFPVRSRQGAEVWLHTIKLPLRDDAGRIIGVVGLSEDVTARKRAELALLDNQSLLQAVLDAIPHNVFVKDREGRVVLVNRAYTRFWGTTDTRPNLRNRDLPHLPREFIAAWEASDERVLEFAETVVSDGDEVSVPGGRRVWLRTVKAPRFDEQNRVIGLVGLSEDITARRSAELALRENQQMLVAAQAIGHIGSWTSDVAGTRALYWSPEVYRIFDMQPEEFDGRFESFTSRIHPADVQHFHEVRDRALKGEATFDVEHRILRPDGTIRWVHERADVLRDAQGRPSQLIGVVQDITEQKEAALALRSQQRLIQAVFDTIPHEVFVKDRASAFVLVNHPFAAFYGLSPETVKGLSTRSLPNVPNDIIEAWIADDQQVMETGQPVDRREFRYRSADGRETWFDLRKFPWRDDENRIVGIVGVREDITERRHTEELVRANRRLLRTVFDAIPHLLYVKDTQSRYIMVNEAMARVYGLTPETMAGTHTLELPGAVPEQREQLLEADRTVMESGTPVFQPEVPIHEGGRGTRWYSIIKLPLRNESGRIIGIVGMSEDITERRVAQAELQTNRRLLRTVFDTIPHLLYVKDAQSRYLMVNAATARVYGLTPETMAGMHTLDLPFPPREFRQRLVEADRAIIESGQPFIQPEAERDEGPRGKRWYSSIKLPLRDEQDRTIGIVGLSEDVTQRRRAEHDLQTNRRLLRAVFDAVPFWLMVRDRTGRATLVNRRMAEDYGVQPEAFLGKTMQEDPHLSAQEKTALEAIDAEVMRTLRPMGVPELSLTLPGERVRLLRLVSIPLFDEAGEREGVLVLAEDITERKRSEQALLQAQKMESLGVLAGGIAHDFNNLLVAILGNASLALLKLKEAAVGFPELKQIELAGQSAADLCRQMLAYAGKGPLEMQRVDVNQLVQEMTQLLRVSLPKGVVFTFRLADTLPPVQGDPTQIRQVIMNLVINAGEAIGDKQGNITLTTGTQLADREYLERSHAAPDAVEGRYVFLEVSDSGHGMGPETLARIFDPFFTTKFTGRGLGLASVIGIIRGHLGALRVYSEPGVGSAFRVLLPEATAAVPADTAAPPFGRWEAGGRVLVVDDEADVLDVAQRMLTHLGFTVLPASSGAEALALLRADREPLRAALIDLTMPGLSGEEVVREMRRIREDLPVLVMSGYNEIDVQSRFMGRPNTGFLQKPFTLAALHAKIRALLGDPPAV